MSSSDSKHDSKHYIKHDIKHDIKHNIKSDKNRKNSNNDKKTKANKIAYNKKDLHISSENTMIIIDWDDTLYPTSWIVDNSIDLTDPKTRYKYMKHFEQLDSHLSSVLEHMKTLGDVIIITNALPAWIELAVSILPKTRQCLLNIDIVSARSRYQDHAKMADWKKHTFIDEIKKRSKKQNYHNILSLGDADFEHNALVNLYKFEAIPHKYLKSIKFIKSTDYTVLIEQIKMIHKHISIICKMPRQIDLTFATQ